MVSTMEDKNGLNMKGKASSLGVEISIFDPMVSPTKYEISILKPKSPRTQSKSLTKS